MSDTTALVFSQLHLPRPLDPAKVAEFLTRLASDRTGMRVALEVRADHDGLRHLLGCRDTDVHALRHMLTTLIPGSVLTGINSDDVPARTAIAASGRLRIRPSGLPLHFNAPLATTKALLSALATPLRKGEAMAVQVILGPRRAPRIVPKDAIEPDTSLAHILAKGEQPASNETRQRMKERLSVPGFAATMRLGATSGDAARRRRFVVSLLGAVATAQTPGVHIDIIREPGGRLDEASLPWRWPLHLSTAELVGLLAWPLGEGELPGMPPAHPKPLRAHKDVSPTDRVFALSAAPGDDRRLGLTAADQMYHGVAYGPSGSGKTVALMHLILADITDGRAVAVLDPKRQLIDDILARIPDNRRDDVVVLDASDEQPVGFNPLDTTGRDPDVVVDGIMAVFESVFRDGWGPRTSDIFSACLRTLTRNSTKGKPTGLLDLPRLLTDHKFRRQHVGKIQKDPALAGFWAGYDSQSPQAQAAVIAAPLNKLRQFLLRPALMRMLSHTSEAFQLRDTFRKKRIVLVPLNEGLIGPGTASLLGSLIVADLWQATQERAREPDSAKHPAMIYVDEAPRFLNLPVSLADALAVSRSLSVGWFLAAQFRSQFPPALKAAVDMNARSKIQFATEHDDARETAKLSRDLSAEDVMALPRFHAYANLVANGHPSGWALVKTLPPPAATTDPEAVRAVSRANYASIPPTDEETAETSIAEERASPPVIEHIGRKWRQP